MRVGERVRKRDWELKGELWNEAGREARNVGSS